MAVPHSVIQNAILIALAARDRRFVWPELTPAVWNKLNSDRAYADRLEFVGDSLVHTAIALRLHERYPHASAGTYTIMMHALVSNATFYHLTVARPTTYVVERQCVRTGRLVRHRLVNKVERPTIKRGGDRFETVLAEYYIMHGLPALLDWTKTLFDELMGVAWDTIHDKPPEWTSEPRKRTLTTSNEEDLRNKRARSDEYIPPTPKMTVERRLRSPPRHLEPKLRSSGQSPLPLSIAGSAPPPTSTPASRQPVMGNGSLTGFTFNMTSQPSRPALVSLNPAPSAVPRPPPEVIDLTMDSDDDESPRATTPSREETPTHDAPSLKELTPPEPIVIDLTSEGDSILVETAEEAERLPEPLVRNDVAVEVISSIEPPENATLVDPRTCVGDGELTSSAGNGSTELEVVEELEKTEVLSDSNEAPLVPRVAVINLHDYDSDTVKTLNHSMDMDVSFGADSYIFPPGLSGSPTQSVSPESESESESAETEAKARPDMDDEADAQEVEGLLEWLEELGPIVDKILMCPRDTKAEAISMSSSSQPAPTTEPEPESAPVPFRFLLKQTIRDTAALLLPRAFGASDSSELVPESPMPSSRTATSESTMDTLKDPTLAPSKWSTSGWAVLNPSDDLPRTRHRARSPDQADTSLSGWTPTRPSLPSVPEAAVVEGELEVSTKFSAPPDPFERVEAVAAMAAIGSSRLSNHSALVASSSLCSEPARSSSKSRAAPQASSSLFNIHVSRSSSLRPDPAPTSRHSVDPPRKRLAPSSDLYCEDEHHKPHRYFTRSHDRSYSLGYHSYRNSQDLYRPYNRPYDRQIPPPRYPDPRRRRP